MGRGLGLGLGLDLDLAKGFRLGVGSMVCMLMKADGSVLSV